MANAWPMVPLGNILTKSEERIDLAPETIYKELTVRLWGKGVTLRREVTGAEIAAGRRVLARGGQFILSRIDARNGAFGLIPELLDGAVVSTDFPVFTVNRSIILPAFLEWLSKTAGFADLCRAASEGTTNRIRLKEDRFLAMEIPLALLDEQRRIVARIEELAARIEEARGLRRQAVEEAKSLITRATSYVLDEQNWEIQRLEMILAESPRNGLSPQQEVDSGGRRMLRINAVSSSPTRFVDLSAHKLVDVPDEAAKPFILQHDDIFIVRYNGDINRVAKAAIFKADGEYDVVYPDKLMRLRPDISKMLPDFLVFALSARSVRSQIEEMGKTTAGQIGVSGADAKSFQVPVPPLDEQRRIVAYLDDLQAKVDALKQLQAQTQQELDALLPSVLDKAFKGEL